MLVRNDSRVEVSGLTGTRNGDPCLQGDAVHESWNGELISAAEYEATPIRIIEVALTVAGEM